ncbi:MAG: phosphotransferase [Alphaproteobacteria bacterium]|jgi:aminoglycoside/choline kinase family phosphotransferase|nr:phosphotransferase [Alphaproteobacteria bacterium]
MAFNSDLRDESIAAFLHAAGWASAERISLGQDASTRRYERLHREDGATAILMDAPPVEAAPCPPGADEDTRRQLGWNAMTRLAASRVDAFVALAGELSARGLSAPDIYAHASDDGLALIEDFGHAREFARLIERGQIEEKAAYAVAAEALAHLHRAQRPDLARGHGETWTLQEFDALALETNAALFAEWLPRLDSRLRMTDRTRARFDTALDGLIQQALSFPRAFTLRDYHAENLIWLGARDGIARVGLLDFQDAVIGWDAWDMAMLVQDARRHVSREAREAAIRHYLDATGTHAAALDERLAVIGALNALRITGLFARLVHRDGKPRYLDFLPRQQAHLAANLAHPALFEMRAVIGETAPFILEAYA